jgi:hypothetical protein
MYAYRQIMAEYRHEIERNRIHFTEASGVSIPTLLKYPGNGVPFDPDTFDVKPSVDAERLKMYQFFRQYAKVVKKDVLDSDSIYELMNFAQPTIAADP